MQFKEIREFENKFVVWGKWDNQCCHDILAEFKFNPLIEKEKPRAMFLAEEFVNSMKRYEALFKQKNPELPYYVYDHGVNWQIRNSSTREVLIVFYDKGGLKAECEAKRFCEILNKKCR